MVARRETWRLNSCLTCAVSRLVYLLQHIIIENNYVAGVACPRVQQKRTGTKKWALLVWGSGNGHPGYAYFCPCRGSAKSVRRGHRARPDSRYDLETDPVAG